MNPSPLSSLIRGIAISARHAAKGFLFAIRSQRNFRIHLLAAAGVLLLGKILNLSRAEQGLLLLAVSLVLMGELLNTAVELLLNLIEARDHPVVRVAKDVAAGAVLLAIVGSLGVGWLLLGPRLIGIRP